MVFRRPWQARLQLQLELELALVLELERERERELELDRRRWQARLQLDRRRWQAGMERPTLCLERACDAGGSLPDGEEAWGIGGSILCQNSYGKHIWYTWCACTECARWHPF